MRICLTDIKFYPKFGSYKILGGKFMKRRWIALVVFGAALCLFLGTPALSGKLEGVGILLEKIGFAPVPKTGSTFNDEPIPGDDGELLMGVTWPDPRFTDNGDGTVTDNLTGLVWTEDAYIFGATNWATACEDCNGLASGEGGLSDGSVAGEWRLPNVRELQSLIDYGRFNPALPENHPFDNVQYTNYWSSTTLAHNSASAWNVSFDIGIMNYSVNGKSLPYYVWCVRDGK
jgi:hypothetical protein